MRKTTFFLALAILLFSCMTEKKIGNQVITLSNGTVQIKLLPAVGGTLVSASLTGHENILNSDSTQWNEPSERRPTMDPTEPFKAYNGMIVWLSPQSEWWVKQDTYPKLKDSKSMWPPDPYLTCAAYKITHQTENEITMESPESLNTHVQFTKTFRIEGNKVFITAKARNCSKDTISWGLWFNTRMNGWDKVFVPADSMDLIKTQYMKYPDIHQPALNYADGCFSYQPLAPEAGQAAYKSKSFFSVENPIIIGYKASQWLIIRGEKVDRARIHPEQGRIEIYVENSAGKVNDLQELEMHFAYEKIAPGATIQASENWEIVPGSPDINNDKLPEEIKVKL
jgi:hypothetical protein